MTNIAIIGMAKQMNGIIEEVDTYHGWKRHGKQVKKGCKALFKTDIWKPVSGKKKQEDVEDEEQPDTHLILVSAAFFGASQVEAITE